MINISKIQGIQIGIDQELDNLTKELDFRVQRIKNLIIEANKLL